MSSSSSAEVNKGKGKGKAKETSKRKGKGKAEAKETSKRKLESSCELCQCSLPEAGGEDSVFMKVPLTVCCASCAQDFISHEGMLLACQTRAMQEFRLSQDDLGVLRYTTKTNPHSWRNPLKLFVRAECEVLSKRKKEGAAGKKKEKLIKEKKEMEGRLDRLVKKYKMDPEMIADADLRTAIFGDYYNSPKPTTKLKAIRASFKLKDHAMRTLPSNPARALNFFVLNEMVAPANDDEEEQAAMTAKFWENAQLLEAVVNNQPASKLIFQFLSPAEARRVESETNLKRLVETANLKDGKERKRLTESLEELGGIPNIDAFLADEAVSGRLKRFDDYGSDEVAVARKLHEFHGTRGNSAARKAALKQAMAAHDVSTHGHYGSTASLVHHFVKGSVDLDLDEVVGIAKISLHLSKLGGYRAWEMKHEAVEEKFRTFLHFECLGLKDSYEKSIKGCRAY